MKETVMPESLNGIRSGAWSTLLLAACLASAPAAAQECEVKIGAVGPMTGSGALWGLGMKGGADLQAALVNSEGGLQIGNRKCKVVVVAVDDQCTAAGGAAASN